MADKILVDAEKLKELIFERRKEGKVVYMGLEGPEMADMMEFIKQPTESILYDLNRLQEVVLIWMDEARWVNDLAVGFVIGALKDQVQALKDRIAELEIELCGEVTDE